MARSLYIYVVQGTAGILATCTVKHECIKILNMIYHSGCVVIVYRNGVLGGEKWRMPAEEFVRS